MGVSLENIEISAPFWEPDHEEEDEEEQVSEPSEEEITEPEEEYEPEEDSEDQLEDLPQLEEDASEGVPVKSGCQTVSGVKVEPWTWILGTILGFVLWARREK